MGGGEAPWLWFGQVASFPALDLLLGGWPYLRQKHSGFPCPRCACDKTKLIGQDFHSVFVGLSEVKSVHVHVVLEGICAGHLRPRCRLWLLLLSSRLR